MLISCPIRRVLNFGKAKNNKNRKTPSSFACSFFIVGEVCSGNKKTPQLFCRGVYVLAEYPSYEVNYDRDRDKEDADKVDDETCTDHFCDRNETARIDDGVRRDRKSVV